MHPEIDHMLKEVARTTGRPYSVVERVLQNCVDAMECGVSLIVSEDGSLTAASTKDGAKLPASLEDDINARYDDMVELIDPILRAIRRLAASRGLLRGTAAN